MIATSRYILNNIALLTMDCAVLKQTLNKKRLRKISTVHTIVKKYCNHCYSGILVGSERKKKRLVEVHRLI